MLELARPSAGLPFADPRLAMTFPVAPEITGSGGMAGMLMTYAPSDSFRTEVQVQEIADLRDAVDRSADVIVSRDPAVLRYGEGSGRYRVAPLTWDAVHVLVRPRAVPTNVDDSTTAGAGVLRFLVAGLKGEVREGTAPAWWSEVCGSWEQSPPTAATADSTLYYPEGDPLAADLAARLVALAVRGDSPGGPAGHSVLGDLPRRSEGISVTDLAARLESGRGYVLAALPTRPLNSCEAQAIWRDLLPSNARTIPLIESRASVLIANGPALRIVRTWDGLLRITSASTGSP